MSFLLCDRNMINFYKKNGWKLLNPDQFKLINHDYNSNGMIYNFDKNITLEDEVILYRNFLLMVYPSYIKFFN